MPDSRFLKKNRQMIKSLKDDFSEDIWKKIVKWKYFYDLTHVSSILNLKCSENCDCESRRVARRAIIYVL